MATSCPFSAAKSHSCRCLPNSRGVFWISGSHWMQTGHAQLLCDLIQTLHGRFQHFPSQNSQFPGICSSLICVTCSGATTVSHTQSMRGRAWTCTGQ